MEHKQTTPSTNPEENKEDKPTFKHKSTRDLEEEEQAARQKLLNQADPSSNRLLHEIKFLSSPVCDIEPIPHLATLLQGSDFPNIVSPLLGDSKYRSVYGGEGFLPEDAFISEDSFVLSRASFGPKNKISDAKKFLRAGPRKNLFFKSEEVAACIVTCGGLCPGLNVVIREVFNSLYYNYRVKKVYGIMFGYKGFYEYEWKELTPENIKHIHTLGGTVLGSSRGGFDLEKMITGMEKHGVNQVYCVGGDGTHRGINTLHEGCVKKGLKCTVVGIPKTIDNDIAIIDKSFGFETAVEEAQRAIISADVEATSAENGIGLVKLMGRQAGFIAMYASLANRDVNICLVPEFPFDLEGPRGLLEYVSRRLKIKKHCVIVVAEGAGSAIRDAKLENLGFDASGNVKLPDVGVFLKDKITAYMKSKKMECTIKYIDPTYMIRSIQANSYDKQICSQLAQNAVHAAMAGWTGFTVGLVNNRSCYIPLHLVTHPEHPVNIQKDDRAWQRLIASTGQPSFLNDENDLVEKKLEEKKPEEKHEEKPKDK